MFFNRNRNSFDFPLGNTGIMPPNHAGIRAGEMGSAAPLYPVTGKIGTISFQRAYNPAYTVGNIRPIPRG